ncbi:WHG domain-containing protein [Microbacterium sp. ARD32]|uniref:TetR/AcrR family transcriptional regulator n=1 Tax=Microbacterium sp. ARD32 TaxID=2962577 RepID=UPI0028811F7B|nr:WHG domain-containing protein [Microbacterium sp. ARD32]MDT0157737.1 WHG domain-containing protein [Microbacterium sp. ARD32]
MPPFHHGNLRAELLDRGELLLRERGVEQLSLRELAREAGVSHGAPRNHFPDRAALLEALAARGFDRLADAVEPTLLRDPGPASLHAAGRAYLDFAQENPALLNLMLTAKSELSAGPVHEAAARMFGITSALVRAAVAPGIQQPERLQNLALVLSSMLQGIASLITSQRIPAHDSRPLLDEAIRVFLDGARGAAHADRPR